MKYKFLLITLALSFACASSFSQIMNENLRKAPAATPPSEEEIGVPYYPGADYIPSSGSGGLLLMFATNDSPEDVTAFYKDKLEGWTYNETYGLFWEGSGDLGYAEILESKKSVAIGPYTLGSYQSAINITIPK